MEFSWNSCNLLVCMDLLSAVHSGTGATSRHVCYMDIVVLLVGLLVYKRAVRVLNLAVLFAGMWMYALS